MYLEEFLKYKEMLGYNDEYYIDHFYDGLNHNLKYRMKLFTPLRDAPMELMEFVNGVVNLDRRLSPIEGCRSRYTKQRNCSSIGFGYGKSSGGGLGPIPLTERNRRQRESCCYYCGEQGHYINFCYRLNTFAVKHREEGIKA
jgi:hypothetical protein